MIDRSSPSPFSFWLSHHDQRVPADALAQPILEAVCRGTAVELVLLLWGLLPEAGPRGSQLNLIGCERRYLSVTAIPICLSVFGSSDTDTEHIQTKAEHSDRWFLELA